MDTGKVQNDKIQPDDEISNEDLDLAVGGSAINTSRSNIKHPCPNGCGAPVGMCYCK